MIQIWFLEVPKGDCKHKNSKLKRWIPKIGNEIPKDKGHETKMRIRNTS